jgi:hypothetical protein
LLQQEGVLLLLLLLLLRVLSCGALALHLVLLVVQRLVYLMLMSPGLQWFVCLPLPAVLCGTLPQRCLPGYLLPQLWKPRCHQQRSLQLLVL